MSKLSFDYAKWDRLEISDDEDTHHPNLDKNLNIRVNRITRDRKEEEIDTEKAKLEEKGDFEGAEKLETKRPLHQGNICHVAEERTIINRASGTSDRNVKDGESFSVDEFAMFKTDNKKILDDFTEADWEQSREMLMKYGHILMDNNANSYYMLTALEAEMAGDKKLMKKLCNQGQIISQIHQLAAPMNRPPRDLVPRFFEKFEADQSRAAFQEGVDHFQAQLEKRAIQKKAEQEKEDAELAAAQAQEGYAQEDLQPVSLVEAMHDMSKEERMGPGGLDPVEVWETLPECLQECFKSGDVDMLKKVAQEMDPKEFDKHFKRCIDSGTSCGVRIHRVLLQPGSFVLLSTTRLFSSL
jgi:cell division cycle protein 37